MGDCSDAVPDEREGVDWRRGTPISAALETGGALAEEEVASSGGGDGVQISGHAEAEGAGVSMKQQRNIWDMDVDLNGPVAARN